MIRGIFVHVSTFWFLAVIPARSVCNNKEEEAVHCYFLLIYCGWGYSFFQELTKNALRFPLFLHEARPQGNSIGIGWVARNFCGSDMFADWRRFVFCGNRFLLLGKIVFCWELLLFAIFRKYPVHTLIIFSFLLSTSNRNTYFQTILRCAYPVQNQYFIGMCTALFLIERDKL